MAANRRTSSWAIVAIAVLLLTACDSLPAESDLPISAPTRAAPLLSIHNPLVVQTGDTVTSSGDRSMTGRRESRSRSTA